MNIIFRSIDTEIELTQLSRELVQQRQKTKGAEADKKRFRDENGRLKWNLSTEDEGPHKFDMTFQCTGLVHEVGIQIKHRSNINNSHRC